MRITAHRLAILEALGRGRTTLESIAEATETDRKAVSVVLGHAVDDGFAERIDRDPSATPVRGHRPTTWRLTELGKVELERLALTSDAKIVLEWLRRPRPPRRLSTGKILPPRSEWMRQDIQSGTSVGSQRLTNVLRLLARRGDVTIRQTGAGSAVTLAKAGQLEDST